MKKKSAHYIPLLDPGPVYSNFRAVCGSSFLYSLVLGRLSQEDGGELEILAT